VIGDESVAFDLTEPSDQLDTVATRLAQSDVVGIGENSHGIAELKTIPLRLVESLVTDHGYRLLAMEGTLGDFAPVNDYIAGGPTELDTALSSLEFYFWRTEGIERLFEWLRGFNEGRPRSEQVEVRGYDAQFHDINAAAIRSYLERVDPDYLEGICETLDRLATPLYERSDPSYMTDAQTALLEDLQERFRTHRSAYIDRSSKQTWRLMKRHVWTLKRGLQFQRAAAVEDYTRGKTIRDRAMAENVVWLREWAESEKAIVMGNSNHTMRGYGHTGQQAARMGQHLSDELGSEYYSLGMLFGTGTFAVPGHGGESTTYDIGGPLEDTPAATLTEVSKSPFFLGFETGEKRSRIETWLDELSSIQFTVPRAAERGAVALPAPPGAVFDGVTFVRDATPASFLSTE
jgi:erythromycin esterase